MTETHKEQFPHEPDDGRDMERKLDAMNVVEIRRILESGKFQWFEIDAALDFIRTAREEILEACREHCGDQQGLIEKLDVLIHNHMRQYKPNGWKEPVQSVTFVSGLHSRRVAELFVQRLV